MSLPSVRRSLFCPDTQGEPLDLERPLQYSAAHRAVPGTAHLNLADALTRYETWPAPTAIVSDGAYGVGGFPGDPPTPAGLAEWYAPHAAAWAKFALLERRTSENFAWQRLFA